MSVLMREDNLWIANAGDSRAVLAKEDGNALKAVDLSVDQNPNSPLEQVRVCGRHRDWSKGSVGVTSLLGKEDQEFGIVFRCIYFYMAVFTTIRLPCANASSLCVRQ